MEGKREKRSEMEGVCACTDITKVKIPTVRTGTSKSSNSYSHGSRPSPKLRFVNKHETQDLGLGTWDLGLGTWDLRLGTWDLGLGTWDLGLGPG